MAYAADGGVAAHEGTGAGAALGNRGPGGTRAVVTLSLLTGLFGLAASVTGLLWRGDAQPSSFTTFRGQTVDLYGGGLYRDDTLFVVGNNWSLDLVTILLAVPLLAVSVRLFDRGSPLGRLLLLGTLGYFVYYGASYALGAVAYNELFLVYVALLSASLFAFLAAFLFLSRVRPVFSERIPRRWIGSFMVASGVVTLAVWIQEPVGSLLSGEPPKRLDTYTTLFTHAFDLAVIVPGTVIAGVKILRRLPFGYVVAFSLLVLEAFLLPLITVATIIQIQLGLSFAPGEIVGPIAGFSIFALLALWVIVTILRNVSGDAPRPEADRDIKGSRHC